MPSTYNNNLRLEIIANGEQSGTWGTTTNNNLGVLLVDAITGVATVNVTTADQAFTILNGVADQSRCAVIELTTSLSSAFNVYAPPVNKTYIIRNTSAQNAVLACDAGTVPPTPAGAGYDIPAGKTVFVYASDESGSWEFHDAVNHINQALSLDSPLGVTSGGTGLSTIPAFSVPVSNSLNTLTALTVAANQSVKLNSTGTAWEAYTPSGGGGSVTQIIAGTGLSGGTITTSGTIALNTAYGDTLNPYASKAANYVLASPDGSAGVPSFRALVGADLPTVGTITPSTYGSASQVAQITVDSKGRITGITNVSISGGGGGVTSISASPPLNASASTGAVTLSISNASSSSSGIVSTGSQNFAGAKTFDSNTVVNGTLTANSGFTSSLGMNFTALSSIYLSAGVIKHDISSNQALNVSLTDTNPGTDNTKSLGTSGIRWSVVYAATGTINTSDANTKQDTADLDDAEKRVAVRIKGLIKKFRFKDAVAEKGDAARIHVGVIAQEVRDAFTAEGLDADRYGMFCSDTWWEKEEAVNAPSGNRTELVIYDKPVEGAVEKTRLGVRYDELLAFVIAAM